MRYFCTYLDGNYLARGLALYASLERVCPEFQLWILCHDVYSEHELRQRKMLRAVPMGVADLETVVPELLLVKPHRNNVEYYYTCGPSFMAHILNTHDEVDILTYLDADLFFFDSPEPLFTALKGHSIGVVGHHLPQYRKNHKEGLYNVGWVSFRRDNHGLSCLKWWRDRCLYWCYERFEDGKYADQLYLDNWPIMFKGFYEIVHKGANVAPWNVQDYRFHERDGRVYVDEMPLIFFHFSGFKQINSWLYNTNLGLTFRSPGRVLKRFVFLPYILELLKQMPAVPATASIRKKYLRSVWLQTLRTITRILIGIIFRQYIVVADKKVY